MMAFGYFEASMKYTKNACVTTVALDDLDESVRPELTKPVRPELFIANDRAG